jgi:HEAT repeat protein
MKANRHIAAAAVAALALACIGDPEDARTWVKKLDDVRERKEAIRNLVRLDDKVAVEPLIAAWKSTHDAAMLDALIHFHDPRSIPALVDTLGYTKEDFDSAAKAAEELGSLKATQAVDGLLKMLEVPLDIKDRANLAKQAAIRALAKIKDARSVEPLAKIVQGMPDEQDLYLNKVAALALAEMPDARAVPGLLRGLFIARADGATIFQECRYALVRIGEPAVDPLVEMLEERNAAINEMAKKLEFKPGVIPYKAAYVLGDLRSKKAAPALLRRLKEPLKGDMQAEILRALGHIGAPDGIEAIRATLGNKKADAKLRQAAADALLAAGDAASLKSLFEIARTGSAAANLRVAAAMALGRLGGKAEEAVFAPVAKSEGYAEFLEAAERLEVAKECDQSVECYAKKLDAPKLTHQEKAAFMLGVVAAGAKDGAKSVALGALVKKLPTTEPVVRLAVIESLNRLADKGCAECRKTLQELIAREERMTKIPAFTNLVNEMRVAYALLSR